MAIPHFTLGVDLDGVVADFYPLIRQVAAQWRGVDVRELAEEVSYGLPEWGLLPDEYEDLHRFAVTQRQLFCDMAVMPGAPQALRRLTTEGIRIRIITHRLFIPYFHQTAIQQTVDWLDRHSVSYADLCFMTEVGDVGADVYVEDSPANIEALQHADKTVLIFSNSTNRHMSDAAGRAHSWAEAEELIRDIYYGWRKRQQLALPPSPGVEPDDQAP
jgi:5'(3')-deoxyribonucleotidase